MRIIHFSDIHAGGVVKSPSGLFDKRLFGMLNHLIRRSHRRKWDRVSRAVTIIKMMTPDLVVCTGDLTTISEPDEFEKARKALLPLVRDKRFEFLFVPGNHDNYVPRANCSKALFETYHILSRERWQLDDLPREHLFEGLRILLVNQAVPRPVFASSGEISCETEAWLRKRLADDSKPTLLLSHFPIFDHQGHRLSWRRACSNNEVLEDAIRSGKLKLALCGHIHTPFAREEDNGSWEVCAGSLTIHGKMNVIEFDVKSQALVQRWVEIDDDIEQPEPSGVAAVTEGSG